MNSENAANKSELAMISSRYGPPQDVQVTLAVGQLFDAVEARPDRTAEVVFAIQRPNGRLVVQTKSFYPPEAYRLPSGSITDGESIELALQREVAEETSLTVAVLRFLAVIHYHLEPATAKPRQFASYVFLLRETGGALCTADESERVAGFREIQPQELPAVAARLAALAESPDPKVRAWGDWGRFRAIVHRVVWESLRKQATDSE